MAEKLVDQSRWETEWNSSPHAFIAKPTVDPLLRKFLPVSNPPEKLSFIELGCAPGNNLVYFNKTFSYAVSGLDYAGIKETEDFLNARKIKYSLIDKDMFKWTPEVKYDVVYSTGVVEHFDPPAVAFDVHKNACKDGGYVVICVPNMRYFNKLLVDILHPGLSKEHNLKMMKPAVMREQFGEGYEILYCGYYKTCLLNIEPNYEFLKRRVLKAVHGFFRKAFAFLRLDNIPNRFFSPNIVVIARKKPAAG